MENLGVATKVVCMWTNQTKYYIWTVYENVFPNRNWTINWYGIDALALPSYVIT